MPKSDVIPLEQIQNHIFVIRGHRVLLDSDLANFYGVPTSRFNQAVKRNAERFPNDFRFQLTADARSLGTAFEQMTVEDVDQAIAAHLRLSHASLVGAIPQAASK